jgi:hypothetical protein
MHSGEIQRFRRAGWKRFEEAQFLLSDKTGQFTTGAMYLAGVATECLLKSLLVAAYPKKEHEKLVERCKKEIGHSFDKLKLELAKKGILIPDSANNAFRAVSTWTTDLRYDSATKPVLEATTFLANAKLLLDWVEGRLT